MKQTMTTVINLGLKLGFDPRWSAKRAFYMAAAEILPEDKKACREKADELHLAGAAKKLQLTKAEVAKVDPVVRGKAFPSGATIARFVGYVRRFPNADPETSYEVYATAAANEARLQKTLDPESKVDQEKADADGMFLVAAAMEHNNGEPISIRDARAAWQEQKANTAAEDHPDSVGDRVEWLISQPKAVAAYVAENAETAAILAAMLTSS